MRAPLGPRCFEFRRRQGSILRQGIRVTDQQTKTSSSTSPIRTIGFLPLLAIFYGYTAGGPFGYEDIFSQSGPGMALVFLTFVPFFWSIPMSFASAELNSILPVQGGFYRWTRAAFGDFWGFQCGWWNWTGTFSCGPRMEWCWRITSRRSLRCTADSCTGRSPLYFWCWSRA